MIYKTINVKASIYYASGGQNPFLNVKASTYYASSGQNSDFFVTLGCKTENSVFSYIAATALGPSSKVRARSEDSGSYNNISVRPLSVEL